MATSTGQLYELVQSKLVNETDLDSAKYFLSDWIGCYAAGGATDEGNILKTYHARWGGDALEQQVFLAAALSHISEFDDFHQPSVTHPACVIMPVAWFLSEKLRKPLEYVLVAALHGYEVMTRIGEALGTSNKRFFYNTAMAGVYGSAAAAGFLLELPRNAWMWSMGNAGLHSAGMTLFFDDESMSRHLNAGHVAQSGLKAALLACDHFTGPENILEDEKGLLARLGPGANPVAINRPSEKWKMSETSLKPWPCSRHTHAAIEAVRLMQDEMVENHIRRKDIQSIEVHTSRPACQLNDIPDPQNIFSAKHSMQFCITAALDGEGPDLYDFEGNKMSEIAGDPLMQKIRLIADPSFDSVYPALLPARVVIRTGKGILNKQVTRPKGDPQARLTDSELMQKLSGLFRYAAISEAQRDKISQFLKDPRNTDYLPELFWQKKELFAPLGNGV